MTSDRSWAALVVAALILLSGCSFSHADTKPTPARLVRETGTRVQGSLESSGPTIAVVPKSLDNPIFLDAKEGAQREGEKLGVHIDWVGPFTTDTRRQVEIIKWLIGRRIDGILISCNNPIALEDVINEGIAAGVKIATFDSDSPDSNRLFYVGTDNSALGVAAAQTLVDILRERHRGAPSNASEGRPLTVAVISGRPEALNLDQRISAFKATAEKSLDVRFLPTLYSNDSIGGTIDLTGRITDTNPIPDVIFFTGGWLFYAPVESMKDYAAWIHSGGIAVTIDATYPILSAEERGLIQGVIGQDFRQMGRTGVEMLYRAIRGERVPKVIYTGISRVTKRNIADFLRTTENYEIR